MNGELLSHRQKGRETRENRAARRLYETKRKLEAAIAVWEGCRAGSGNLRKEEREAASETAAKALEAARVECERSRARYHACVRLGMEDSAPGAVIRQEDFHARP